MPLLPCPRNSRVWPKDASATSPRTIEEATASQASHAECHAWTTMPVCITRRAWGRDRTMGLRLLSHRGLSITGPRLPRRQVLMVLGHGLITGSSLPPSYQRPTAGSSLLTYRHLQVLGRVPITGFKPASYPGPSPHRSQLGCSTELVALARLAT